MIFSDEIAKSIFHELAQDIFRLPEHKQEDGGVSKSVLTKTARNFLVS